MTATAAVPPRVLTCEDAPGISVYFMKVTPEVAKELLALNTKGQRSISDAAVERYAADMITNDWIINGDTIRISATNELLDGQHRLSSIVESEIPQVLLVVHGLDKDAILTIDAGRKRSFADMLKMKGISNHALTASIISRSLWWYNGNYGVRNCGRIDNSPALNTTPSHAQKFAHVEKLEEAFEVTFEAAATFATRAYARRPGISQSTYGLAWIILSGIDRDRRNQGDESDLRETFFHELLVEPQSPSADYPINALTNRLGRVIKSASDSLDNVDQLDALFTAFNRWYANKPIDTIRRPPRPLRWNLLAIPTGFKECNF